MGFLEAREHLVSKRAELNEFEENEQKIRGILVKNLLLQKEEVKGVTDDSTNYLKESKVQNCVKAGGLRSKKGIHTKELY